MSKNIVSFGDSFIFGLELGNNPTGCQAWPGLVANNLRIKYQTCAVAGCGNDHIARQIYSYFANNSTHDTLAVINWTWAQRWDFYIVEHETWITLGPTCVPEKLKGLVDQTQANDIVDFYRARANSSLLWNKFRNLQTIWSVQNYLKQKGVTTVQTYMDYDLFDQKFHAPDYVTELQDLIKPSLSLFEEKNFVDWSRSKGFEVTGALHPLEKAHQAAAELWQEQYSQLLFI